MSKLEVDAIEPQSGTTITIGAAGDTVNLIGTLQSNGSPLPGDISEVVAGTGLSGGGTTGAVTINIDSAQPTITSLGTITSFTSTGIDDNADATAITIDSSERVGVGNTSPLNKLDVQASADNEDLIRLSHPSSPANAGALLGFNSDGTTDNNVITLGIHYSNDFYDVLNIQRSTRNVGIGTVNPQEQLDISSNSPRIRFSDTSVTDLHHKIGSEANDLEISCDAGNDQATSHIGFKIDNSEKVRMTDTGRVGIGTSLPSATLHVDNSGGASVQISRTGSGALYLESDGTNGNIRSTSSSGSLAFQTNGNNERMRITSAGNVGIQQTNPAYTVEIGDADSGRGIMFNLYSNVGQIKTRASSTDLQTHMNFEAGLASAGTIKTNNGSTSYNTSSDYRLKENVDYDWEATTRLKQLKPARFNWIADSDNTILDGFIAHEVTNIVPEAVSGEKDAIQVWLQGEELPEGVAVGDNKLDADGNTIPDYQGIDQSKLVPLLVKTIQELEARITTLENA